MSKDYNNVRVPMSCSVPFGLLKDFDEVAQRKGRTRSGMVVELMKMVVEKDKKERIPFA